MWMTSNTGNLADAREHKRDKCKNRTDVAFGQAAPKGRLTDSEFDEWLKRAGEPSPTIYDVGRWKFKLLLVSPGN